MPRTATIVQVFVSSPSDVAAERALLESLLRELNQAWSRTLNVVFELIRWETSVRPAWGTDPQAIINEQVGDAYDVFIGILWGRFGTPTPRAESGTQEEFDRAVARLRKEGRTPEIMVYFKDSPIPPSKIDPEQLAWVQAFRASVGEQGGVYGVFEDEEGFQASLRAHLAALAQKFSTPASGETAIVSPPSFASPLGETVTGLEDDDLGYLDYVEIYETKIEEMTRALDVISDATARIGEQMNQRTAEVEALPEAERNPKTARRLIRRAADDLEGYANIMQSQLPLLGVSREGAMSALSSALALYEDLRTDGIDLPALQNSLVQLTASAMSSKNGIGSFRRSVYELPRMTADLNRAKRVVLQQLDGMLLEIDKTVHTAQNVLSSIERMKGRCD